MSDAQREYFIELLSHVLRNQVSAMSGFASLIEMDGELNPDQMDSLNRVTSTGVKVNDSMPALIEIAWLEAGLPVDHAPVDVCALLHSACDDVARLTENEGQGMAFRRAGPPTPLMVNGNAALLKRALAEPIRNAAAYSPQGSAVTVSCAQDGGDAIVVIADQGIGMTPMDRDSAFDRYFRSRDVRVRAVYGHGIGLTLARQIVAAHGGTIALESIPDAGTTVTIRLPLVLPG